MYLWIFLLVLAVVPLRAHELPPFNTPIEAGSAIMMDAVTGKILYAKNIHQLIHPASTTKIATALLSLRILRHRLDEQVMITKEMIGSISPEKKRAGNYKAPAHWIEIGSSHMGLKLGEQMSVYDLLRGCLIASANDASNALALTACSSYEKFMEEINALIKELGCTQTCFINAHGLYHPEHVTTVYDLALLGRALIQEPILLAIVAQRVFHRPQTNKQAPAFMHNTNRLMQPGPYFCRWAQGIKTGFTQQSGASLISYARSRSRQVLLVVSKVGSYSQVFEVSKKLLEQAMEEPKVERLFYEAGEVLPYKQRVQGANALLEARLKERLAILTYPSEELVARGSIRWLALLPPVYKGQFVGSIDIINEQGQIIASSPLIAGHDLFPSTIFRLKHWVYWHPFKSLVLVIGSLMAGLGISLLWRQ